MNYDELLNWITEHYDKCKTLFLLLLTSLLSVISPIQGALAFLGIAFAVNIFVGVMAALNVKGEQFSIKKFVSAVKEAGLYAFAIVFLYWCGSNFNDETLSITGVKWVAYIAIWGYLLNIFKNGHIMFPKSKPIDVIYLLLSTEVFWKLKDLIGLKRNKNEGNSTENQ